jgi:hypothetical protein
MHHSGIMDPENQNQPIEQDIDDQAVTEKDPAVEAEYKVTVRKLEVPVRPRGVLAE